MLVVNCREPKTLNDTQYLHLHLIRSETADTRPQHVVFTCGLRNTVKESFLKVETSRVWCRGEVWRCLMDIPGYHSVPSSSSSALTPPEATQLQRGPEVSVGCTDWTAQPQRGRIWNSDVNVRTNRKQDTATAQLQWSKFWSQLRPGESSKSSGNLQFCCAFMVLSCRLKNKLVIFFLTLRKTPAWFSPGTDRDLLVILILLDFRDACNQGRGLLVKSQFHQNQKEFCQGFQWRQGFKEKKIHQNTNNSFSTDILKRF